MPNDTSNPSPFAHLDTMISAYADATDPKERTLFLRGIVRALEHVSCKTHAALEALTNAVSSEAK
jgi:hypothetical protein